MRSRAPIRSVPALEQTLWFVRALLNSISSQDGTSSRGDPDSFGLRRRHPKPHSLASSHGTQRPITAWPSARR